MIEKMLIMRHWTLFLAKHAKGYDATNSYSHPMPLHNKKKKCKISLIWRENLYPSLFFFLSFFLRKTVSPSSSASILRENHKMLSLAMTWLKHDLHIAPLSLWQTLYNTKRIHYMNIQFS